MSTTCTGWSLFDVKEHKLLSYGIIRGKNRKDSSPYRATLKKMQLMATEISNLVKELKPTHIVIEEIAGSKNRLGQKTLDMLHGIVWIEIEPYLDAVTYYDVTGIDGWRTHLGLKLTEADKANNKEAKKINKDLAPSSRLPVFDAKDLACRYANKTFGLTLDPQTNQFDADLGDSISMGSSFIRYRYAKHYFKQLLQAPAFQAEDEVEDFA